MQGRTRTSRRREENSERFQPMPADELAAPRPPNSLIAQVSAHEHEGISAYRPREVRCSLTVLPKCDNEIPRHEILRALPPPAFSPTLTKLHVAPTLSGSRL